jgi:hypothetical protein
MGEWLQLSGWVFLELFHCFTCSMLPCSTRAKASSRLKMKKVGSVYQLVGFVRTEPDVVDVFCKRTLKCCLSGMLHVGWVCRDQTVAAAWHWSDTTPNKAVRLICLLGQSFSGLVVKAVLQRGSQVWPSLALHSLLLCIACLRYLFIAVSLRMSTLYGPLSGV